MAEFEIEPDIVYTMTGGVPYKMVNETVAEEDGIKIVVKLVPAKKLPKNE